jgi:hypothetical protein
VVRGEEQYQQCTVQCEIVVDTAYTTPPRDPPTPPRCDWKALRPWGHGRLVRACYGARCQGVDRVAWRHGRAGRCQTRLGAYGGESAGFWANCLIIVEQNTGRSCGERLEIKLPSTTTSSSTTLAPAL